MGFCDSALIRNFRRRATLTRINYKWWIRLDFSLTKSEMDSENCQT